MALLLPSPPIGTTHFLRRASPSSLPSPLLSCPRCFHISSCRLPLASVATQFSGPLRSFRHRIPTFVFSIGKEETDVQVSADKDEEEEEQEENRIPADAMPEDLECVNKIKRVLELLKKNRDMTFGEVKLTIMIEDPRDIERKRLLGVDPDDVTREDLVAAMEDVNEGRIPENRVALRLLAKELSEWPDLEIEVPKKSRPGKSLYAKATDTGIDPKVAAKRLNVDWDAAADIADQDDADEIEVPPVVGYGALYLVTALPIIIGISVVLILFYNSLQ